MSRNDVRNWADVHVPPSTSCCPRAGSDASCAFDDKNAGDAMRYRTVRISSLGKEYRAWSQPMRLLGFVFADLHIDLPVQDDEDFRPVINVPDVGLVGPVEADGHAIYLGNAESLPSAPPLELSRLRNSHRHLVGEQTCDSALKIARSQTVASPDALRKLA